MDTPRRRMLLEYIWQRTSLSRAQFAQLYRGPLDRYASWVQLLPASESHHHAYLGGMLDHGLEIVAYALKLRLSHLLPVGAPSETQAAQSEAWTAAAAYAALLHDIGKIAVNFHVEYADGTRWHPWHGPLTGEYRFRHLKQREYRLHGAAAGLLYTRILDATILDWLNGFPELWSALLYVLAGQYEHAGVLGELVVQADKASVAQDLGGDPTQVWAAPKNALQRKLLDGLRYLLKEELRLNQPQASDGWLTNDALWLVSKTVCDKLRAHLLSHGVSGIPERNTAVFNVLQDHGIVECTSDGNAIWKATVMGDNGWSHAFTFLRLSPAMIWEHQERPPVFKGTVRAEVEVAPPVEPDTTLPSREAATPSPSPALPSSAHPADTIGSMLALFEPQVEPDASRETSTGDTAQPPRDEANQEMQFIEWLRRSIQLHHLVINDAKALVHAVGGTAYLVSPGIFQRYIQEHPHLAALARQENATDWQWVQKRFERLKLHRKQNNGLNIWICEVAGPRRTRSLHGYLLKDGKTIFSELPPDNPHLKLAGADLAGTEGGDARARN